MAAIGVQSVFKIFGNDPQAALNLLEQGKSKADVLRETGQVVGIQDVNFQLDSGELFVIMGLSGSGKSTLLRCINRLVEPTKGVIYLQSDDRRVEITSLSEKALRDVREKRIAMIFQHFALFPYRTVISNVTFGLEIQGVAKQERMRKGHTVLELVGLGGWAGAYPSQLSGGMQQRVGLARALATDAEVLLMDEPFSALDPLIKVNMQDELLKLREKVRRTILFVTHDLDEALKVGDRIAIMEDGRIVQLGTPEEIIVNPRTEYVARFVEHADPTGVLTAGTIVKELPIRSDRSIEVDVDVAEAAPASFAEERGVTYCISADGRPINCLRNGETLPIKTLAEIPQDVDAGKVFLSVSENATLREIMQARLETSNNPIVVVSQAGKFSGVVTETEILQGILEKGRKGNHDDSEKLKKGESR